MLSRNIIRISAFVLSGSLILSWEFLSFASFDSSYLSKTLIKYRECLIKFALVQKKSAFLILRHAYLRSFFLGSLIAALIADVLLCNLLIELVLSGTLILVMTLSWWIFYRYYYRSKEWLLLLFKFYAYFPFSEPSLEETPYSDALRL